LCHFKIGRKTIAAFRNGDAPEGCGFTGGVGSNGCSGVSGEEESLEQPKTAKTTINTSKRNIRFNMDHP